MSKRRYGADGSHYATGGRYQKRQGEGASGVFCRSSLAELSGPDCALVPRLLSGQPRHSSAGQI